jgi:hypothetical protein
MMGDVVSLKDSETEVVIGENAGGGFKLWCVR